MKINGGNKDNDYITLASATGVGSSTAGWATITSQASGQFVVFPYQNVTSTIAPMYSGNRFLIVVAGRIEEMPDGTTLERAVERAGELAHQNNATAYILKPVTKVAPKRDVTVTEL